MAKILIVEDDNHLREIYELRMQAAGHEVVSAADGEEALKVAIKEKPDLVISDVMMPKISGFDMLDILRSTEETKNAKIIMMTALSQSEDKQRAENLGADRYLVKSQVTLDDVAQVTEEVLSGKSATPIETTPESTGTDSSSIQPTTPTPQPATPQPTEVSTSSSTLVASQQPTQTASDNTQGSAQVTDDTQQSSTPQPAPEPVQSSTPPPTNDNTSAQSSVPPQTDNSQQQSNPQSIESEESAIAKQLEQFMHTGGSNNTEETAPQPTEEPTQQTPEQQVSTPEDRPSGTPTQQPTDEQQPPSVASNEAPSRKKKVIQPLNDLTASKSDELEKLLKKEEVREEMSKIVTDIKSKDIADLSDDNSAEHALKEAQTEFTKSSPQGTNPVAQPEKSNQDIQVTKDGIIVKEDPEEAAAAEVLHAAQANKQQQNTQASTPASATPIPEPSPVTPPSEPLQAATQPAQQATQPSAENQVAAQTQPNIPHTNGTSMDGVVPSAPQQQSFQNGTQQPPPQDAPASQSTASQPQQTQPPVQQEQELPTSSQQQALNPNDITL